MIGHDYRHQHYWLDALESGWEYCGNCGYYRPKRRPGFLERLLVAILLPINRFLVWLAAR